MRLVSFASRRLRAQFESWDANSDGEVSRPEFHRAMGALGLEVAPMLIDEASRRDSHAASDERMLGTA